MKRLIAVLMIVWVVAGVYADVNVVELARQESLELQWDPYRRIGVLKHGGRRLMFRPGSDEVTVDFDRIVAAGEVSLRNGAVLFSDAAAETVRGLFEDDDGSAAVAAIVIDPGHGGRDPGTNHAHTIDGVDTLIAEKDIVLDVCLDLHRRLSSRFPNKQIVLTRDTDVYLPLEERVEIANSIDIDVAEEAIVFVSVHVNASPFSSESYGYEVWYLPPEYGRKDLVREEDVGEQAASVLPVLNLLKDEEYTVESILLAQSILSSFDDLLGDVSMNRGLKEESWFVVRNAKMPSVLVELGFITNRAEAIRMTDPAYLRKMAAALYNGISEFVVDFESRF